MTDQSKNSSRKTAGKPSTPSPESEDGPTPFILPGGQSMLPFGPEAVHASLGQSPAVERVQTIRATSGPLGSGSSASASLQQSLASNLQDRMQFTGSPLYRLTWKALGTPLGVLILQRQALGRPLSVNDFTGWPTPTVGNATGGQAAKGASNTGRRPDGSKTTVSLNQVAKSVIFAGWPTPMAGTPAQKGYNAAGNMDSSRRTVELAGWVSPSARDWKDTPGIEQTKMPSGRIRADQLPRQAYLVSGEMRDGLNAQMGSGVRLNPLFSLWLQGYPDVWASFGVPGIP